MHARKKSGFTLIELSIVLVIIGLIVGGILIGQDLIRAAVIRGAARDIESINSAVNTFRTKYNCLPGDCPNAQQLFNNCSDIPSNQNYCNGNGNGIFDGYGGVEGTIRFFQHLQLASLLSGPFTAMSSVDNTNGYTPGLNVPSVSWITSNSVFDAQVFGLSIFATTGWWCPPNFNNGCETYQPLMIANNTSKNMLVVSTIRALNLGFWLTNHGGVSLSFARTMDMKFDDGIPTTGQIRVYDQWLGGYYDSYCVSAAGAYYPVSGASQFCPALAFMM